MSNPIVDRIDQALARSPFQVGDKVTAISTGKTGTVIYIYYNGFALVDFGPAIIGGIFNNDSTFRWSDLEAA
ncbi:hypothetical protein LCGC14_1214330 [marine sediment metagenome]|uniref:Uncharacterized protein n=1 Tax=marine sediment metagenome TaxID=412755 RepID=A0A0F9M0L1_9ZZZZ